MKITGTHSGRTTHTVVLSGTEVEQLVLAHVRRSLKAKLPKDTFLQETVDLDRSGAATVRITVDLAQESWEEEIEE